LLTFGMTRAAEVYLIGVTAKNQTLIDFAEEFKRKYFNLLRNQ